MLGRVNGNGNANRNRGRDVRHSTGNRYGDKITTDAARLGDTTEPYLFGGHSI